MIINKGKNHTFSSFLSLYTALQHDFHSQISFPGESKRTKLKLQLKGLKNSLPDVKVVSKKAQETQSIMIKARAKLCCLLLKLSLFSLDMGTFSRYEGHSHFWPPKQLFYGLFFTSKKAVFHQQKGCVLVFLSKKVEILIFCFLFFFSSSRPLTTFNCQKCTFWFKLKELENYLYKNILIFLR